jgi:O-antigen/teichoic acid export membrane protein
MELSAATSVTESVVKVVLAPLLIVLGFGIMGALVGHMVSYVVAGLLGVLIVYRIYREHSNPGLKFNFFEDLRFMFRFGVPLYSSVLLLSFLGQFRSMVLAWFTSDFEIGNYMVASNFLSLLSVLAIPISTALFPAFSKFDLNKERGELRKFFRYSLKYILLVIVPASMLVALISKDLVYFLYGVKYSLAPFFLTLLVLTYLYIGFSLVVSSFFNGIGRTEISFRISLMNCFVGVPLGLVLTMFYGVPGLIVSMIISGVTSLAYALRVAVCRFGMSFDVKSVVKIYLAAFLSAIPVFVVVTYFSLFGCLVNLFLAVMIFVGFYLVLVPVMGAIKEEDIDNLRNIFGKIKMLAPFIDVLLRFEHMVLKLCGYCS